MMDGEITAAELEAALDSENEPLVVDIRTPPEFEHEHISGSVNIPMTQLPQKIDEVADADHVVTVCPHGKASIRAAQLIDSFEGFDGRVDSLECGLTGWEGPVESNGAEAASDAPF